MRTDNKNPKPKIIALMILLTVFAVHAAAVTVSVNAPENASLDKQFDVEIEVDKVEDLDSGQFDISFDPSVVNVTDIKDDVEDGDIEGTKVPVENKYFIYNDTIRVLFNLPGVTGVSGSGTLATIRFKAMGEGGDTSFLNFSDGILVDKESDLIPSDWVNDLMTIRKPPVEEYAVTVYVKNVDDDKQEVHLLIDGGDEGFEKPSSGTTKKYGEYNLEEGVRTFKIKWFDTDTDKWYEKTEEHTITGATTIILLTDEHDEEEERICAYVYVHNLDADDDLNVYLYIDDKYKKYELVKLGEIKAYETDGYEFDEEGVHTFEIKWRDPDTAVEYEKRTRKYIKSEESITMYTDSYSEDDLITTASIPSAPKPAPVTSAASGTLESSSTTTPAIPITVLHTDPISAGGNDTGAGQSQSQYHHLYTLVGAIAILVAAMQIRKN